MNLVPFEATAVEDSPNTVSCFVFLAFTFLGALSPSLEAISIPFPNFRSLSSHSALVVSSCFLISLICFAVITPGTAKEISHQSMQFLRNTRLTFKILSQVLLPLCIKTIHGTSRAVSDDDDQPSHVSGLNRCSFSYGYCRKTDHAQ